MWRRLEGEHRYDRRARLGNWFGIWVPLVLSAALAGVAEGYMRGWDAVHATPLLALACTAGTIGGAVWIRSFNQTRYDVDSGSISHTPGWPRKGWRVRREEVEALALTQDHGHWILSMQLRTDPARRRLVLTRSMRERLDLP